MYARVSDNPPIVGQTLLHYAIDAYPISVRNTHKKPF